jgi:hypothetical protein
LTTCPQRWTGVVVAIVVSLIAAVGWWLYVPWDEQRGRRRMEELEAASKP